MESEQTAELATALAKAQAVMGPAIINKMNPHFKNKYADLAAVLDAIRKPLADNGLSVTQTTEIRDGGFVLVTRLRHTSGQWVSSDYPLPVGAKPQELGSALTYARRYSLSALACIAADEDDDAESANGQPASTPKASPIKPVKQEAPVHPETGEVSPHAITAADELKFGQALVAAVNSARDETEVQHWIIANNIGLETLKNAAPKIYDRVIARVAEKRKSLEIAA